MTTTANTRSHEFKYQLTSCHVTFAYSHHALCGRFWANGVRETTIPGSSLLNVLIGLIVSCFTIDFATKQPTINSEYSMGNNTQTRDVYAYSSLRNCTGEWHHDQSNSSFYLHRTPKVMFSSLVVCCFLLLPVGNITHKRVNGLPWYFRDRSDIIQGISWNILEIQHP